MTLFFSDPGDTGSRKSSRDTDVVNGQFLEVVPDQLIRQCFTFQSEDSAFAGAMLMTWTLTPVADGTEVSVAAENVPAGIKPADHEAGMASSIDNLARHVEQAAPP